MEVLRRYDIEIKLFRDIRVDLLTECEIHSLAALAGGMDKIFSTRATLYRELGLGQKRLSEQDMMSYMTTEWTLVRRPIIVAVGGAICVGGNLKVVEKFVQEL